MMDQVITHPEDVTPAWLTAVLRDNGVLPHGRVTAITPQALDSQNSKMTRLHLIYSHNVPTGAPASLMLKIVLTEPGKFGASEVDYYRRDYAGLARAPLVPCYHAVYDERRHAYHLLLADLSATHRNNWEKPLTPAYGRALAEALATLHAHWWGIDRLKQGGMGWPGARQIDRHLEEVSQGLAPLLAETATDIPAEWVAALHQIVAAHPQAMRARLRLDDHFTLIHGDANPGNILSPIVGETPLYLVDRQPFDWSFTHWLGVFDLAYGLGLWGKPAWRRRYEKAILRHYHEALIRQGITNYGWTQLWQDYKLCLLQQAYVPMGWCAEPEAIKKMKWVWLPQLQRVMTAVFDLNCLELLSPIKGTHGQNEEH